MPGMLAGSRFKTSSVASVPPVEAPRPMIVESSTLRGRGGNGIAEVLASPFPAEEAAEGAAALYAVRGAAKAGDAAAGEEDKALGCVIRTFAFAAVWI